MNIPWAGFRVLIVCWNGHLLLSTVSASPSYDKSRWLEFVELDFIGLSLFTVGPITSFVG
jgi:hypothetical protein